MSLRRNRCKRHRIGRPIKVPGPLLLIDMADALLDQRRELTAPLRRRDGEEMPFTGHTLELMRAALLELQPRPDHEVAQRA
jgi:hypothetical protein